MAFQPFFANEVVEYSTLFFSVVVFRPSNAVPMIHGKCLSSFISHHFALPHVALLSQSQFIQSIVRLRWFRLFVFGIILLLLSPHASSASLFSPSRPSCWRSKKAGIHTSRQHSFIGSFTIMISFLSVSLNFLKFIYYLIIYIIISRLEAGGGRLERDEWKEKCM